MLTKRLLAVSQFVSRDTSLADIGSDHALLPIYLLQQNLAQRAIVSELGNGPYERLRTAVAESDCSSLIEVRQGDGLQVLSPGEVHTVVLAGMGGDTMAAILAYDKLKTASFAEYVFQPMSKPDVLRREMARQGLTINHELVIKENRKYYVIIHAKSQGRVFQLSDLEADIGPIILYKKDRLDREYQMQWLEKYRRVVDNARNARNNPEINIEAYHAKIAELEGLINAGQG